MNMNHHTPALIPTPLCASFEPLLTLLLADELDAEQIRSVRAHLDGCRYCQQRLSELELTVVALRHQLLISDAQEEGTSEQSDTEPVPEPVRIAATSKTTFDDPFGVAMPPPIHLTLEDIVRASQQESTDSFLEAPASLSTRPAGPGQLERSHGQSRAGRLLGPLGAIAAILLLALLASALFGALRGSQIPAATGTPTPQNQAPFVPYLAPAPGLPCDTNPQASAHWSGDQGTCLSNPARTQLVAQGHLAAAMRWEPGPSDLPDIFTVSVQVTLVGSSVARLQVDNSLQHIGHMIECRPNQCDVDGQSSEQCACDTSGPLTLTISVNGRYESFSAGAEVLGQVTETAALRPDSIGLGVSPTDTSAQGGQAIFANFAVTVASQPTLPPVTVLLPPNCQPVVPGTFPTGLYIASDSAEQYEYLPNGEARIDGAEVKCYFVEQQKLLFVDPVNCHDTATEYGVYSWTFDGTNLRLKVVHDLCIGRRGDLQGQGRYWIVNA